MPSTYKSYPRTEPGGPINSIDNGGVWPEHSRSGSGRWDPARAAMDKLIVGGKHLRVHCANTSDAARCATALNSYAKSQGASAQGWRVATTVMPNEDKTAYCFARKVSLAR